MPLPNCQQCQMNQLPSKVVRIKQFVVCIFCFAYTLGLLILSLYLKEELTYCADIADMHLQPNLYNTGLKS